MKEREKRNGESDECGSEWSGGGGKEQRELDAGWGEGGREEEEKREMLGREGVIGGKGKGKK